MLYMNRRIPSLCCPQAHKMEHKNVPKLFQQNSRKMNDKSLGTTDILKRPSGRGMRDTLWGQHHTIQECLECRILEIEGTDLFLKQADPAASLRLTTLFLVTWSTNRPRLVKQMKRCKKHFLSCLPIFSPFYHEDRIFLAKNLDYLRLFACWVAEHPLKSTMIIEYST